MRFLADECLHEQIVAIVRETGHEVATIASMEAGATDELVLQRAASERAILLTVDKDFGEIVIKRGALSAGISCSGDRRLSRCGRRRACCV